MAPRLPHQIGSNTSDIGALQLPHSHVRLTAAVGVVDIYRSTELEQSEGWLISSSGVRKGEKRSASRKLNFKLAYGFQKL